MQTWMIEETSIPLDVMRKQESLLAQGNGTFGWRGTFEEGFEGDTLEGTYLNGFYEEYPVCYPEIAYGYPQTGQTMLNVANAKWMRIFADGEAVGMRSSRVTEYRRALDFRTGVLERHFTYRTRAGKCLEVRLRRLISFTHPKRGAIYFEAVPDKGMRIEILSGLQTRVRNQSAKDDPRAGGHLPDNNFKTVKAGHNGDALYALQHTLRSRQQIACAADHQCGVQGNYAEEDGLLTLRFMFDTCAGEAVTLEKRIAYTAEICGDKSPEDVLSQALSEVDARHALGFDELLAENRAYLSDFWGKADIKIEGDDALQLGLRFNSFHILQSVGRDGRTNIAAKGLTGEGYEGHTFWDTEMFVIPALLTTRPDICRSLLAYRYRQLDAARARAREMGHRTGALFAWRTIGGGECSTFFPAGTAQYHIDGDIAYAVKQYLFATDDRTFLYDMGAELLFETARLWADLGHYRRKDGAFCIDMVTGPDEYTAMVNNNFYTNRMARENLWTAHMAYLRMREEAPEALEALARRIGLSDGEPVEWKRAGDHMAFPYDEETGVCLQDDSFSDKADWDFDGTWEQRPLLLHFHPLVIYRHRVLKQADTVLADLLFDQYVDSAQIRRDFLYYEPLTTHDSSLSACTHSMVACRIGMLDKAYDYFLRTACTDLDDHQGNTRDGVHIANMAGTSMCMRYGFGGMRLREDGLLLRPVIPGRWRSYAFHLTYRGRLLHIRVDQETVRMTLKEGAPMTLTCYEEKICLTLGECVERPMCIGGEERP